MAARMQQAVKACVARLQQALENNNSPPNPKVAADLLQQIDAVDCVWPKGMWAGLLRDQVCFAPVTLIDVCSSGPSGFPA